MVGTTNPGWQLSSWIQRSPSDSLHSPIYPASTSLARWRGPDWLVDVPTGTCSSTSSSPPIHPLPPPTREPRTSTRAMAGFVIIIILHSKPGGSPPPLPTHSLPFSTPVVGLDRRMFRHSHVSCVSGNSSLHQTTSPKSSCTPSTLASIKSGTGGLNMLLRVGVEEPFVISSQFYNFPLSSTLQQFSTCDPSSRWHWIKQVSHFPGFSPDAAWYTMLGMRRLATFSRNLLHQMAPECHNHMRSFMPYSSIHVLIASR